MTASGRLSYITVQLASSWFAQNKNPLASSRRLVRQILVPIFGPRKLDSLETGQLL